MNWIPGWQAWEAIPGVALDVFCRRGSPGPTVLVTAGIHGDEYEGPAAVSQLAHYLGGVDLVGTVVAVPVANPSAYAAGTRTNPEDGLNLARCFPGDSHGRPTERLAAALFQHLATPADYLIDLHSGGVEYMFLPLAGFYGSPHSGNPSFEAAHHFGLPYLWQLPSTLGVLSNEAARLGKVAIGNEYLGGGKLSLVGAHLYFEGIVRCLAYWKIVQAAHDSPPSPQIVLTGDWMQAGSAGLFQAHCELGQTVEAGTIVASIADSRGTITEEFRAESPGLIAGLRNKAGVREGNWAVLLAKSERPL